MLWNSTGCFKEIRPAVQGIAAAVGYFTDGLSHSLVSEAVQVHVPGVVPDRVQEAAQAAVIPAAVAAVRVIPAVDVRDRFRAIPVPDRWRHRDTHVRADIPAAGSNSVAPTRRLRQRITVRR